MTLCNSRSLNISIVVLALFALFVCQIAYAQTPVVTQDELKQALTDSANTRKENLAQVRNFFSSSVAGNALKSANIDSKRLDKAVSTLDPSELAKLAAQTRQIQNDFAAGVLNNQQITYILIALATAVIVLIAVR